MDPRVRGNGDRGDRGVAGCADGADVADALQQLVEIVRHVGTGRVLQALVVHDEALAQVFAEPRGGPLAECGAAKRAHAMAYRQDRLEAVVAQAAGHLACAFPANL